jgi:beta-glucuronidase
VLTVPAGRSARVRGVHRRLCLLAAVAGLAALALPAAAAHAVDTPVPGARYETGPDGRYLLGGDWQFRLGASGAWQTVAVPHAWNATDPSRRSFLGTVGIYRKDFRLPSRSRGLDWIVRFESVNYRARVSLNGRVVGRHAGAYLPFEVRLPDGLLRRGGANRLEVRVDNRRRPTDFPPSGLNSKGEPTGGWWNDGGLLREVVLREVDRVDLEDVQVLPELPCVSCDASVLFRVRARNLSDRPQRTRVTGRFGAGRVTLGTATIPAGGSRELAGRLTVRDPRLWEPGHPALYPVAVDASVGGRRVRHWTTHSGIRSLKVSANGELLLNGKVLSARGMALHEDSPGRGAAIDNADRDRQLDWIQDVGATMIRSHYPLHPHTYEEADRRGLLAWSEVPVYSVEDGYLRRASVRDAAVRQLRENVLVNGTHPSIAVWSIANELSSSPAVSQGRYIAEAARAAKALDRTRLVGIAVAGYPSASCEPEYGPLDVIGMNVYFGWYPGPNGQIADRTLLSDYLERVRRCYRTKAIFASEFGVEANREGPADEKGTYAFQQDWVRYVLGVFDSKPWLAGAIYWTIQEFRVRPDWDGGNPYPEAPLHQKGIVTFDGRKKPAYADVQELYRAHAQLRGG